MDSLTYMMIGYLVIWALAFGFMFNMWSVSRRTEKELEAVRVQVKELEDQFK